jgi:hypothetical protein
MTSGRRISHWITCLAILLNLLAMPLHARQMQLMEQMPASMTGGDCASHMNHAVADETRRLVDILDPHPHKMQHGDCCCTGAGGMAGTPAEYYRPLTPRYIAQTPLLLAPIAAVTPRHRWTSLNPRASPLT